MPIFKILLEHSDKSYETSLKVLQFLRSNVSRVNQAGFWFDIKKITEDDLTKENVELLECKGITGFPALINHKGKPVIGCNSIYRYIRELIRQYQEHIQNLQNNQLYNGSAPEYQLSCAMDSGAGDPQLAQYMATEMMSKEDEDDGAIGEQGMLQDQIARKMNDQMLKRKAPSKSSRGFDAGNSATNVQDMDMRRHSRTQNAYATMQAATEDDNVSDEDILRRRAEGEIPMPRGGRIQDEDVRGADDIFYRRYSEDAGISDTY